LVQPLDDGFGFLGGLCMEAEAEPIWHEEGTPSE
jgi:hypothetical protein